MATPSARCGTTQRLFEPRRHAILGGGNVHGNFKREIVSDFKNRPEGIRTRASDSANDATTKPFSRSGPRALRDSASVPRGCPAMHAQGPPAPE